MSTNVLRKTNLPTVCMIVRNLFITDTRVLREGKALIEADYSVTIIAIHDPNRTPARETKDGIKIIRISRNIMGAQKIRDLNRKLRESLANYRVSSLKRITNNYQQAKRSAIAKAPSSLFSKILDWLNLLFHRIVGVVKKFAVIVIFYSSVLVIKILFKLIMTILLQQKRLIKKHLISIRFYKQAVLSNASFIHAHDLNTLIPAFFAAKRLRVPLIYDAHEISTDRIGWKHGRFWKILEGYLIRRTDAVITTDYMRAEFLAKTYHISGLNVIRNVSEKQDVSSSWQLHEVLKLKHEEPIILYQGGIQIHRGLEQLIEAVPLINKGTVVLMGNGANKERLKQKVRQFELEHRVKFIDSVPPNELLKYTASAYVGLQILQNTCFNNYSTTSNKLFEYLMAGIPVIASDFPEIRKILTEFSAGVLVDPHKPAKIAEAINNLFEDKPGYQLMKRNAKKASNKYNWENEKRKLVTLYSSFNKVAEII